MQKVSNFFFFLLFGIGVLGSFAAISQTIVPGTFLQRDRDIRELKTDSIESIVFHPSVRYDAAQSGSVAFFDPIIQTSFNSSYSRSYNDGSVWKGKGLTQEFHGGVFMEKGVFRLAFIPTLYFSQNSPYELASINPFKNQFNYQFRQMSGSSANIDFVQRFGSKSFANFTLGQSEIKVQGKKVSAGISTQNFTLGPARKNHLLMSNGGQGFPFFYLNSSKIHLKSKNKSFGFVQAFLFYGLLKESDYFDTNTANDTRYINGLSVGYELPNDLGISFGFSKVLYKNTEAFEPQDIYSPFRIADDGIEVNSQGDTIKNTGNDTFDQLASAFVQWKVPGQDLRFFFELGKNDFTGPFRWTVTEFEHNRLYTLGLEKLWRSEKGELYFLYEHTYLPFFKNYIYRNTNSTYTHTEARQGYTHKGQLLGPGIGPGSVSDMIDISWLRPGFLWGLSFSRIRFDEDYFITQLPNVDAKLLRHDVEYSLGAEFVNKSPKMDWGLKAVFSYRYNTYFIIENDKVNAMIQVFGRFNL